MLATEREMAQNSQTTQVHISLHHTETDVEWHQQETQDISRSALTALQRTGDSFREMVLLLEQRRSEVEQQIRSEEKAQLRRVRELQDRAYFEHVSATVSTLSRKLKLTLEQDLRPGLVLLSAPESTTRDDFLPYSTDLTWDPNTVNKWLYLTDGNRRAVSIDTDQKHPDHPDRFSYWRQVLSKESLTGRCYFEVEWSGTLERSDQAVYIAASYRDIEKKGEALRCKFGGNDKSWALECGSNPCSHSFRFEARHYMVSGSSTPRIGVYLDHSAGALLFYRVQDQTMTLLHRVQTSFTQPLYAGVWVYGPDGTNAHLRKLK